MKVARQQHSKDFLLYFGPAYQLYVVHISRKPHFAYFAFVQINANILLFGLGALHAYLQFVIRIDLHQLWIGDNRIRGPVEGHAYLGIALFRISGGNGLQSSLWRLRLHGSCIDHRRQRRGRFGIKRRGCRAVWVWPQMSGAPAQQRMRRQTDSQ